ncbi:Uroporphyrin-3 C-methyltransferase OS=Eoetvoesiella caeni OX=645616 GN=DFR37_103342 PE=4 SV=1 [Eoetvoesiella caeni]
MTESKIETQPADNKPAAANKQASAAKPSSSSTAVKAKRRPILGIAFVVLLLIAAALAAAVWYQQKTFKQAQTALLEQAQSSAATARQAASTAQQALELAQSQSARVDTLKSSQNDAQAQVDSLEQAFQMLTDKGSDLVLINDIDHLVQIANQQLTLSGNAGNAIVALETAQAQLARANRPSLAALQQAINGDVDRLRAVSTIDVAQLSARLDELGALVGSAPLLIPDDAAPGVDTSERDAALMAQGSTVATPADPNASWWRRSLDASRQWVAEGWSMVRHDLGSLLSVRRVQDSSALLLSPDQAGQLRENLRLRVMTAQLALMMRQPSVWSSEMQVLVKALASHFDTKAVQTQQAQKLAAQLAATSIAVKLPTVNNSMQALDAVREANTKAGDQAGSPSSLDVAPQGNGAPGSEDPQAREGGAAHADGSVSLPQAAPGQTLNGQTAPTQE